MQADFSSDFVGDVDALDLVLVEDGLDDLSLRAGDRHVGGPLAVGGSLCRREMGPVVGAVHATQVGQ